MVKHNLFTISLVFIVIMVLYVFLQPVLVQNPVEKYANPLMNNSIVADVVYRDNTDLNYAAARWGLNISEQEKRHSQQVAPILNPQSNSNYTSLWGSAPAAQNTSRIPDKWSTLKYYNHPVVSMDNFN
jgi:hypothetical protein